LILPDLKPPPLLPAAPAEVDEDEAQRSEVVSSGAADAWSENDEDDERSVLDAALTSGAERDRSE
jgi:hypothetical protein